MRIKINLSIFLFLIIFYLTNQIEIYGILMLFAVIHELGHLITGICLGLKPKLLNIMPFGLSVIFSLKVEDYNKKIFNININIIKKLVIALAGPFVNLVIVLIYMFNNISFLGLDREIVIYSNLIIMLFNLLPIYPLDGGKALKQVMKIISNVKNANIYINKVSNISIILITIISSIAIYYYKNFAILIIIIYLWYLVMIENRKYKTKMRLYKILE